VKQVRRDIFSIISSSIPTTMYLKALAEIYRKVNKISDLTEAVRQATINESKGGL
jgi:uncharacterized protein Yka (UPF0111/DUF47 family)